MHDEHVSKIYESIGEMLLSVMPESAVKMSANGEIGDDWSKVTIVFFNETGLEQWFDFKNYPSKIAGDVGYEMQKLRGLMVSNGSFSKCLFTIDVNGKFSMQFGYD